jgi:hypothetical protein
MHAPESERVECLLADLAARVGAEGRVCVGFQTDPRLPVCAAVSLLEPYGVRVHERKRAGGRFIFAGIAA